MMRSGARRAGCNISKGGGSSGPRSTAPLDAETGTDGAGSGMRDRFPSRRADNSRHRAASHSPYNDAPTRCKAPTEALNTTYWRELNVIDEDISHKYLRARGELK